MDHPCVSCAMRGSLVQLLASIAAVDQYDAAIVNVPTAGDTHAIATEIDHDTDLHVDAVITTIDTTTATADLTGEDLIRERGIPTAAEDGRAIAEVVVRQLEYADAAVLTTDDESTRALIQAINPKLLIRTSPADLLGVRLHVPGAEPSSPARSRRLSTDEPSSGSPPGRSTPSGCTTPSRTWSPAPPAAAARSGSRLSTAAGSAGTASARTSRSASSVRGWPTYRPTAGRPSGSSTRRGRPSSGTPSTATARRTSRSPASTWTSGNYGSASTVVSCERTKRSTP